MAHRRSNPGKRVHRFRCFLVFAGVVDFQNCNQQYHGEQTKHDFSKHSCFLVVTRQKMSSAKRQCIDFVELKLDEFEATNRLPPDAPQPKVWDFMQCRYPIDSVLLRSRLLRWWATVFAVYRAAPNLLTFYNLTPSHKRADFFKFHIVRARNSDLEASMWGCELAILNLLKPGDNMAIFYRYWRAPGTPAIEKKQFNIDNIGQRLGLEHYPFVNDIILEFSENRKFLHAPEFRRNLFQRQVAAFREWICCYFMLGLDCDIPIVEAVIPSIN